MRASVNGIDVSYELEGPAAAPVVMLSHSLATTMAMWRPQRPALSREFRLLRYDMRGHGETSAPAGPYSFAMLAGDALGLLDHLKIDRAAFVGLSIGGMIGQYLAIHHPERLSCVALCSTTSAIPQAGREMWDQRIAAVEAGGMDGQVQSTLERWFTAAYRAANPDVMDWIAGMIRGTPVAGFVGCGHAIKSLNLTAELKRVKVPTLVMPGEKDPGTPPAVSEVIRDAIPGAEYAVIADAAHLANVEQAAAFNDRLLAFLRKHRS